MRWLHKMIPQFAAYVGPGSHLECYFLMLLLKVRVDLKLLLDTVDVRIMFDLDIIEINIYVGFMVFSSRDSCS